MKAAIILIYDVRDSADDGREVWHNHPHTRFINRANELLAIFRRHAFGKPAHPADMRIVIGPEAERVTEMVTGS